MILSLELVPSASFECFNFHIEPSMLYCKVFRLVWPLVHAKKTQHGQKQIMYVHQDLVTQESQKYIYIWLVSYCKFMSML